MVTAMVTVMARLVGFVSRIVARMIAHRYVKHQCAYVLFYSNRSRSFCCAVFNVAARILDANHGDTDCDEMPCKPFTAELLPG